MLEVIGIYLAVGIGFNVFFILRVLSRGQRVAFYPPGHLLILFFWSGLFIMEAIDRYETRRLHRRIQNKCRHEWEKRSHLDDPDSLWLECHKCGKTEET